VGFLRWGRWACGVSFGRHDRGQEASGDAVAGSDASDQSSPASNSRTPTRSIAERGSCRPLAGTSAGSRATLPLPSYDAPLYRNEHCVYSVYCLLALFLAGFRLLPTIYLLKGRGTC
jgi:hypothetical protein